MAEEKEKLRDGGKGGRVGGVREGGGGPPRGGENFSPVLSLISQPTLCQSSTFTFSNKCLRKNMKSLFHGNH